MVIGGNNYGYTWSYIMDYDICVTFNYGATVLEV